LMWMASAPSWLFVVPWGVDCVGTHLRTQHDVMHVNQGFCNALVATSQVSVHLLCM
jgi:hypothetical protein